MIQAAGMFCRGVKKMVIFLLYAILGVVVLCLAALVVLSPNKVKEVTDLNDAALDNSIAEKQFVEINGVKMGMIIKSKDVSNPVLLFLHGGPGMPEYFLTEDYPTGMENYFTVVWWDQRGAGLSYGNDIDCSTITTEQYIEDIIAATHYLAKRFGKDKIYLMAHSGGTYFGIQAVHKVPQLYEAYIGVAQIAYQVESERLAYDYMLGHYMKEGDRKTVKKLQDNDYLSEEYKKIRDDVMHRAGIGTTRDMKSVIKGVFLSSLKNREYSLVEKINLWRGKVLLSNHKHLQINEDLREKCTTFEVPIYFFSGAYDYTVNYKMSEEYLQLIDAPLKCFYLFENSAHSPFFEEPDKVALIFKSDIIKKQ
ncbi:alpha/beta hydrolase [Anoxynatronum sibiricum]|uniref:Alpha/beta hydrolase n=1 Tax=Anoxynatronum sibiricum TaxID=210623 RepID=A0ABU9VU32_9CLOT